jgi:hypothetical protein
MIIYNGATAANLFSPRLASTRGGDDIGWRRLSQRCEPVPDRPGPSVRLQAGSKARFLKTSAPTSIEGIEEVPGPPRVRRPKVLSFVHLVYWNRQQNQCVGYFSAPGKMRTRHVGHSTLSVRSEQRSSLASIGARHDTLRQQQLWWTSNGGPVVNVSKGGR